VTLSAVKPPLNLFQLRRAQGLPTLPRALSAPAHPSPLPTRWATAGLGPQPQASTKGPRRQRNLSTCPPQVQTLDRPNPISSSRRWDALPPPPPTPTCSRPRDTAVPPVCPSQSATNPTLLDPPSFLLWILNKYQSSPLVAMTQFGGEAPSSAVLQWTTMTTIMATIWIPSAAGCYHRYPPLLTGGSPGDKFMSLVHLQIGIASTGCVASTSSCYYESSDALD
jgi:hypothetical protein